MTAAESLKGRDLAEEFSDDLDTAVIGSGDNGPFREPASMMPANR